MALTVEIREIGDGITVVEPVGEFEVYTSAAVKQVLGPLTEGENCRACLSLARVTFLDSKGIGVIVEGTKRARSHGGDLALVCPSERFARHIKILRLDEFLTVVGSDEEAIAKLAGQGGDDGAESQSG